MPLIDLAVFDIAGTTIYDSDFVNQCVQDAMKAAGFEVPLSQINATMGLPKPVAIARLFRELEVEGDVDSVHTDFVERMKKFYRETPDVRPIEGVEEAFDRLRNAGIKIALDTGFSSDITEIILERVGWNTAVINAVVSSDQVPNGRPYADMIQFLMKQTGVLDINRVAKIGDAPADLQEGTNAGCPFVVGVLCGTHNREQLEPHPHTHLIDSVREFPELVLGELK